MSSENAPSKRRYEKRRRAEKEADTRRRITEATVALHGSVGPARTTISAVAERAGVQRATVYRHFPDEESLIAACSSHWAADHPPPDPSGFGAIADPRARLRTALAELYGYYRRAEPMLSNVTRDAELIPALAAAAEGWGSFATALEEVLAAGWEGGDDPLRRAAIAVALDFRTWRLLTRQRGLADREAVEVMARAVLCPDGPA